MQSKLFDLLLRFSVQFEINGVAHTRCRKLTCVLNFAKSILRTDCFVFKVFMENQGGLLVVHIAYNLGLVIFLALKNSQRQPPEIICGSNESP